MKKAKLTPWFPSTVNPVRVGEYEIKFADGSPDRGFRNWDGARWVWLSGATSLFGTQHGDKWRGLSEQPK